MTWLAVRKAFEQTLPGAKDDERPAPPPIGEPVTALEDQLLGLVRLAIEDSSGERHLLIEPEGVIPLEEESREKTDEVGEATADNPSLI